MMSGVYYFPIYLFLVTLFTFIVLNQYSKRGVRSVGVLKSLQTIWAWVLCAIIVVFIGSRPVDVDVFGDMAGYYYTYMDNLGEPFVFEWDVTNIFFDNFIIFLASKSIPATTAFIIFAALYFGEMLIACQKLFPKDTLLAFLVCLAAFSTFSYGTNGMKAGMAASTFLVAIAYCDNLWISIPLVFFSYGQHHSMSLVITTFFIALFIKKPKYCFGIWIVSLILAALHVTYLQTLLASFTDEHGADYLLSKRNSGFRPDFILYSAVPVYLGYLMIYKYKFKSQIYVFLLNLYLLSNSLWMLCMYANFNNRIAYLSWFMYPFVLLYPFVSQEQRLSQGKYLRWVVWGHLCFTLFMGLVYYA